MEKIKLFIETDKGKDIIIAIIIILVGLGSFGLGRLSKNTDNPGIEIEYQESPEANIIQSVSGNLPESSVLKKISNRGTGSFFASSRGSKYYSIGCGGGKTIKEENRIYFATSTDAENAGYELSSSCK